MHKRRIKSYENFIEERVNEGLVDWIKEKFKKIGQYFNELKGKSLVALAASILPKELVDYIKLQAGLTISESVFISEEVKSLGNLGSGFDVISTDELNSLSEEEYDKYLQKVADEIVFEVDVKGNVSEQDKELHDFLVSRGISINKETIVKHEKSLDNIYKKIDELNIGEFAKKSLKFASIIFFFGMIVFKATGAHAATNIHSGIEGGDKNFKDTHGDDNGDDIKDDIKDDTKGLWDKLTGKKVTSTPAEKQIEVKNVDAKKVADGDYSFFTESTYDDLQKMYDGQNDLKYLTENGIKVVKGGPVRDVAYCEKLAGQEASAKCNGSYKVLESKKFENDGEYVYFMLVVKSQ